MRSGFFRFAGHSGSRWGRRCRPAHGQRVRTDLWLDLAAIKTKGTDIHLISNRKSTIDRSADRRRPGPSCRACASWRGAVSRTWVAAALRPHMAATRAAIRRDRPATAQVDPFGPCGRLPYRQRGDAVSKSAANVLESKALREKQKRDQSLSPKRPGPLGRRIEVPTTTTEPRPMADRVRDGAEGGGCVRLLAHHEEHARGTRNARSDRAQKRGLG
jgi:hypothetical protein